MWADLAETVRSGHVLRRAPMGACDGRDTRRLGGAMPLRLALGVHERRPNATEPRAARTPERKRKLKRKRRQRNAR
jgi:hypothetical protein